MLTCDSGLFPFILTPYLLFLVISKYPGACLDTVSE